MRRTIALYMCMVAIPDNDTVEVVSVVMNNMENYLPTFVVDEDEEK